MNDTIRKALIFSRESSCCKKTPYKYRAFVKANDVWKPEGNDSRLNAEIDSRKMSEILAQYSSPDDLVVFSSTHRGQREFSNIKCVLKKRERINSELEGVPSNMVNVVTISNDRSVSPVLKAQPNIKILNVSAKGSQRKDSSSAPTPIDLVIARDSKPSNSLDLIFNPTVAHSNSSNFHSTYKLLNHLEKIFCLSTDRQAA